MPPREDSKALILRLGYDPTELKRGLEQAQRDTSNYAAKAALLSTELKATKVRLQTEYTAEFRRQTQQRIADIQHEMSVTSGAMSRASGSRRTELATQYAALRDQRNAQKQILVNYTNEIHKVQELTKAQTAMASKAREASVASRLIRTTGIQSGAIQTGLQQAIEEFRLRVGTQIPGLGFFRGFLPVGKEGEDAVTKLEKAFGGMALPILGATGVIAGLGITLGEVTHKMMEFAQSIANTSAATGLAYGDVQRFNELAKVLGLDAQTLNMAFARLQSQIGEFLTTGSLTGAGGSQFLLKVLNQLGIALRDTSGKVRPVIDVLSDFYDAMQKIPDQNERTALTLEAFGTRGRIIAQVFGEAQRSGESFREVMERVSKVVLPDEQVNMLLREKASWDELVVAIDAAKLSLEDFIATTAIQGATHPGRSLLDAFMALGAGGGITGAGAAFVARQASHEESGYLKGLPLTKPGESGGVDVQAEIAALEERRKKARELYDIFKAGDRLHLEIKQKTAELESVVNAGDVKREKLLISQIDALKQQVSNQKEIAKLTDQANKALEKALAQYRAFTSGLRQGEGGPFGTVAPKLVDALNKKIGEELQRTGVPLPLFSFGLHGFTGNFGGVPPSFIPPSISGGAPGGYDISALLGYPSGPAPVPGALPVGQFQQLFTTLQSKYAVNLMSAEQYIDALKKVQAPLEAEIKLRSQAKDMTQQQRQELEKMLTLLKQIGSAETGASKDTAIGSLIQGFKDIADIVGKFSAGLNKTLSEGQASFEVIQKSLESLQGLTGAKNFADALRKGFDEAFSGNGKAIQGVATMIGAYITGIASIVRGPGGALGALSGALTGAELGTEILPGPGTAIGAIAGGIGGIFGSGKAKKKAQEIAQNIVDAANKITQALNLGATDLQTAIAQLKVQLAAAQQIHGKGTKDIRQQTVDSLTNEINQLEAQQKQILESFRQTLANAELPSGMASFAQQLEQIAKTLKDAAGAGATAAEQIKYLDVAMKNLTTSMGDTLRDEESNLLGLMQQDISIRDQQKQVLLNESEQIAAIKGQLGVGRQWTPAQQAALQILQIKQQATQQLSALKDQQTMLEAQIGGEAQLFGLSMKDLDAQNAKANILALQVKLQKEATAELVAQIAAEQKWYQELLSGKIPALPVGALPPGFNWPGGGGNTFGDIVVNVNSPTDLTPQQLAQMVRDAMLQITRQRLSGLQ